MEAKNSGGRPRNNWTPSRVRKLARLTTLGNIDVSTTQKILGQTEDGFQPCLRDVYKQLAAINPQKHAGSSRRRNKLTARNERRRISMQMKPQRQDISSTQRQAILISMPTDRLLRSEVVEDSVFYNPLAHWDYFSDPGPRFVTLEQVLKSNTATTTESNVMVASPNSVVVSSAAQVCASANAASGNSRAVRKRRLHGMVARSELSFVVSLLSSRWTKSCLHTRVLSTTSGSQVFWGISCDSSSTPDDVRIMDLDTEPEYLSNLRWKYSILQPEAISLHWRPCCGLVSKRNRWGLEPSWQCDTCGFSTAFDLARGAGSWRGRMATITTEDNLPSIDHLRPLVDMVEDAKGDPLLSEGSGGNDIFEENSSAFMECIEEMIHSAASEHVNDESHRFYEEIGYTDSNQLEILRPSDLLSTDRFGNTVLHHAAAARNFDSILILLKGGAEAAALNTLGQTFLHLLGVGSQGAEYLEILQHLMQQPTPFPFRHRDHYGLTIAHIVFCSVLDSEHIFPEQMTEIYTLVGDRHLGNAEIAETVGDVDLDFQARFAVAEIENWVNGDTDLAIEVDKNGDTCLLAMLKAWPDDLHYRNLLPLVDKLTENRQFIATINAYDRCGKNALMIAAGRGMLLIVERLLALGANPNATDFERYSVLENVQIARDSAKNCDTSWHTSILLCESFLISRGAVRRVDPFLEFGTGTSTFMKHEEMFYEHLETWEERMIMYDFPSQRQV
ncbi:hypothetical protein BKA64DRAFT_688292 [Cadophora sp. MPI-SDFR-AT-0126]|nr:hypothetical protein BKA64DRAFT_688292 [Leotiomycetes sp. MPI-SDFR-AT-0126]